MEIGQRVRTSDSVVIAPNRVGEVVEIGNGNVCLDMQGYGPVWYEAQHLEAIPDDGKQPASKGSLYVGQPIEVRTSHNGETQWKRGTLLMEVGHFHDTWLIELKDGGRIERHIDGIRTIPSDELSPATPEVTPRSAPLLRQKNSDGEVMSARNVLLKFPDLATHQPHLFLRGSYAWYSLDDLNTPPQNYIVLDAVHESGATCTLVTYRVFVIDEGE